MEKNSVAKAIATLVMWTVAAGIGISALIFSGSITDWVLATIVLAPMLFSFLGTLVVWDNGKNFNQPHEIAMDSKAKRQTSEDSRMRLLLEMMDDEEREAFKEALKRRYLRDTRLTDDGEIAGGMADLWEDDAQEERARY